jgi:transcriptional regulator with XRE-family HTH domain
MDIGDRIRASREQAGLSQAELARRTGTSQATISAYERGSKQPSVDTLDRLLAATGSRLVIESGHRPLLRPSRAQLVKAARTLSDVIALADALPTRHDPELRFPPLPGLPA